MRPADPHNLKPLWERSRNGDASAWNALVGHLRSYLKALIRSWLGPDLAARLADSDVVQEVLLRMEKGRATLHAQTVPELLNWSKTIAYHAALDARKRLRREPGSLSREFPDHTKPALQALADEEDAIRLAAALERLSPRRREVVVARLIDQDSFAEIAGRLGGSAGSLRLLFLRAVRQLRTLLESAE
jgi:RNA polymerase sigma-70 factor (ECF subfamily)